MNRVGVRQRTDWLMPNSDFSPNDYLVGNSSFSPKSTYGCWYSAIGNLNILKITLWQYRKNHLLQYCVHGWYVDSLIYFILFDAVIRRECPVTSAESPSKCHWTSMITSMNKTVLLLATLSSPAEYFYENIDRALTSYWFMGDYFTTVWLQWNQFS